MAGKNSKMQKVAMNCTLAQGQIICIDSTNDVHTCPGQGVREEHIVQKYGG